MIGNKPRIILITGINGFLGSHLAKKLQENYTVFGQLFNGFEVLNKIATLKTDSLDSPIDRVSIKVSTLRLSKKELTQLGGFSFLK